MMKKCRKMAEDQRAFSHLVVLLPLQEVFYKQEMLISLQNKSLQAPSSHVGGVQETWLTPLARIANLCLDYIHENRPSVQELLQDPFLQPTTPQLHAGPQS